MRSLRHFVYECLQHIFNFDPWHICTLEERPYAQHIANKINQLIALIPPEYGGDDIIEIGCGLGDIIANINYPQGAKIGYDISSEAIRAARVIHPRCEFKVGSFGNVEGCKIAFLIMVNFLHAVEPSEVEKMICTFVSKNEVQTIVVDSVQSPPYPYFHDYTKLLKKHDYAVIHSRGFEAWNRSRRKILFFSKTRTLWQ